MQPKRLHPGAVLENSATLEGGAVFSLEIMFLFLNHETASGVEPFWLHFFSQCSLYYKHSKSPGSHFFAKARQDMVLKISCKNLISKGVWNFNLPFQNLSNRPKALQ